jgi:hypothetical protein
MRLKRLIKKEGKNYFLGLRIEIHQTEAKKMLDRIAKAEMVYSLQNKGEFAEFAKLIELGYLPSDVTSSETTGYNYSLKLAGDRKRYSCVRDTCGLRKKRQDFATSRSGCGRQTAYEECR